jgi:hypothetical protein
MYEMILRKNLQFFSDEMGNQQLKTLFIRLNVQRLDGCGSYKKWLKV